jgi:ribonuclease HI
MSPQLNPQPAGMMKINVDASVSKNKKISSAVVVDRNTAGVFLGASAIVLEGVTDLETMEVMACREGLALATDLGLQDI